MLSLHPIKIFHFHTSVLSMGNPNFKPEVCRYKPLPQMILFIPITEVCGSLILPNPTWSLTHSTYTNNDNHMARFYKICGCAKEELGRNTTKITKT